MTLGRKFPGSSLPASKITSAFLAGAFAFVAAYSCLAQTIVYQDNFDNDTLAVNTGIGGGAANNTILRHVWDDNGDLDFNGNNRNFNNRAVAYSLNSFQSTEGFELSVNYTANNIGASLANHFSFGLIRSDTDLSSYAGLNPFGNTTNIPALSVYSIGVNLTNSQSGFHAGRGLNFVDGTSATSLNATTNFTTNASTPVVIRVLADGSGGADWSYLIGGVQEAAGNIPVFDLASSYQFAVYGQDNEFNRSIQSVTLGIFEPDPVVPTPTEPTPVEPEPDPVFILVDSQAVNQLLGSALPSNIAIGQIASQVHGTGLRDLNKRIFRLRNRIGSNGGFARADFERRGREVSASRLYRMERELKVESTINLNGPAQTTNSGGAIYDTAVVNDQAPLVPAITMQAGQTSASHGLEAYASFDYGYYDLKQLGQNAGVTSRSTAGTVGVEHVVTPNLAIGLGFTHVQNESDLSRGLGSVDLDGNAVSGYASYFKNNIWGDLLYSYGAYEASINRNTLLGSTVTARPNIDAHQTTLNLGYNIPGEHRFNHGPTFRADYSWGKLDGYSERGDPRANTTFQAQQYESMITTLGYQLNWRQETSWGCITPQLRLGYGRENNNRETNVSGTLQNSPIAFVQGGNVIGTGATQTATLSREDPGEGWMELGAGFAFELQNNFTVTIDYQGRFFQQDAQLHTATVKGGWRF